GVAHDGTLLNSIESAPINLDGSLGAFAIRSGYQLTTARAGFAIARVGMGANAQFVYAIGGRTASGELGDVERAYLDGNGTLGTFIPAGVALANARAGAASAVVGHRPYVLGGTNAGRPLDSIAAATI